jgi:uncharacterized protein YdeI (YjbR/CyaY-like superfamily)
MQARAKQIVYGQKSTGKDLKKMINARKMTTAGLSTIEEDKKTGSWNEAYTDLKRCRIPSDLKRALHNFQRFATELKNHMMHATDRKTYEMCTT